jgi:acetoin utilization deacetylase AcuC-like enzyme
VLVVSLHMNHGSWDEGLSHPETGGVDEVGAGAGTGYNVNVPLDFGTGDSGYKRAFEALVVPEVDAFRPTFIVIACGVDGSQMDPNGRQTLTTRGFFELGRSCRKLADKHASSRSVVTLEGGYHLSYAALCVHAVLAVRSCLAIFCSRRVTHLPCRALRACRTPDSRTRCLGRIRTRRSTTPQTHAWTR